MTYLLDCKHRDAVTPMIILCTLQVFSVTKRMSIWEETTIPRKRGQIKDPHLTIVTD